MFPVRTHNHNITTTTKQQNATMIYGIYSVRGWGIPDSKVRGTNMEPTWVLSAPDGPHIGPMNLAIRDGIPWRPYCRNNRECHPGHHYYPGAQPLSQINANHFQEQRAFVMLVDCIYGCLILKWVAEAWLMTGCQDNSPAMSGNVHRATWWIWVRHRHCCVLKVYMCKERHHGQRLDHALPYVLAFLLDDCAKYMT